MIWTALIIGFAGSLHCLGMCSPLAMAVSNMSPGIFVNRLLYNAGRILTYAIMGGIVSSIGLTLPVFKFQNLLSITVGVMLLAIGVSGLSAFKIPLITNGLSQFSLVLKKHFSSFLQRGGYLSRFFLGCLNGILPCGVSYLALGYCISLRGPLDGFVFMTWFGIGTLPVMLGLTGVFSWVLQNLKITSKQLTASMLVLSGLALIARVFIIHAPHASTIREGLVDIVVCR
jgi:uncharacterized protein